MSPRSASALAATAALSLGVLAACSSGSCCRPPCEARPAYPAYPATSAPLATGTAPAAPASAFDAQAAQGQALYARHCASCHGAGGQGSAGAPPLVGAQALPLMRAGAKFRTGPFHTAGDVARFVVPNMPPVGPKPSGDEDWAILAFALKANGVTRPDAVGPANADTIVLHP